MRVRPAASSRLELFDRHFLRGALDKWTQFQIGHRHHYSVERLLAFRDYCDRTSRTRVLFVCVMTLVPAFFVAILIECIPLRPPSEGWQANYLYWVRLFVSSVPNTLGSNIIVKEGLDAGVVSNVQVVFAAIYSNACNTALLLGFAAVTTFPVPYGSIMTIVPYAVISTVFIMLAIGPCVLARSAKLRQEILVQILAFGDMGLMQVAYASFGAVFNQLSGNKQTLFVFVLPVLKFIVKQCVARAYRHLHEAVGLTIVFSVDICNVLYVVACMQTATSTLTTVAMIATDSFFIVLALQSIYSQANGTPRQISPSSTFSSEGDYLEGLTRLVRKAFRETTAPQSRHIRVAARFPLSLSHKSVVFMEELSRIRLHNRKQAPGAPPSLTMSPATYLPGVCDAEDPREMTDAHNSAGANRYLATRFESRLSSQLTTATKVSSIRLASHQSAMSFGSLRISSSPTAVRFSRHEHVRQEVEDALQALFHSEYILMAEYVECAIPSLYAVYLALLYCLPTAAYYPQTSSMTPDKLLRTQLSILLYATLELSSFAAVGALLRRRFGFLALYQLAFALETRMLTVQGFLFLWVLSILEMNLVHNGAGVVAPSQ